MLLCQREETFRHFKGELSWMGECDWILYLSSAYIAKADEAPTPPFGLLG